MTVRDEAVYHPSRPDRWSDRLVCSVVKTASPLAKVPQVNEKKNKFNGLRLNLAFYNIRISGELPGRPISRYLSIRPMASMFTLLCLVGRSARSSLAIPHRPCYRRGP